MTEEQIKAHHDLFIRRYNIDVDPVVNCKKLREAKAWNIHWDDKKDFPFTRTTRRGSFKMIFLPPSELSSRTWSKTWRRVWNILQVTILWIIQVTFKIMVDFKMCKNCFFKSTSTPRLASWVAFKIKVQGFMANQSAPTIWIIL